MEQLPTRTRLQSEGRPGRVLMLITTLGLGGAETQVARLAIQLRSRGWAVAVACLVKPNAYVEDLGAAGVSVYSLDMPRGIADLRAVWKLRGLIKRFQPDVVHSHMVHANLLGRAVRLLTPIPALICTAHNIRETSERGGPTWHKELLYRLSDRLADQTTIICHAAYQRYIEVGASIPSKLMVIPNGVDTQQFSPLPETRARLRKELGLDSRFVWLAVGRLVEAKDYPTLLAALRSAAAQDSVLLIAGQGALLEPLKGLCTELGISDRVRFLGARTDIRDLYQAADAFVMSSKFEGLSIALLEASSTGLPSVVTDVGGNAEIVMHGKTGYVVPSGSPAELAEAMQALMQADPSIRAAMGHAAREYCIANYRLETITEKWIALYQSYMSSAIAHLQPEQDHSDLNLGVSP